MYTYISIYICIRIHTHTNTHKQIHTHTHVHNLYTKIFVHTHVVSLFTQNTQGAGRHLLQAGRAVEDARRHARQLVRGKNKPPVGMADMS